ncbi:serine hydrolase domain-containing protein [Sphingorhabdus sp. 109]|uniref:serine hydrolase domain-containing protein n=1 Tax=Sphingorhabdus sp. 109 TaxID=2653173 RepID=UPI0012F261F7|nr:serine hydrolase [Sphingorhabdus sp. 109]VWX57535.1 Serine hydrolase [Sphingorhabdus sp. 109]
MLKKLANICVAGALLSSSAMAQSDEMARYDRALAAGYKAQFICSGLWNGGKTLADIKADELTGIYDRVAETVPLLVEDIDMARREVRVPFTEDAPPRIAVWNSETGCTSMPIGFEQTEIRPTPAERRYFDDRTWPMGDREALSAATARPAAFRTTAEQAFQTETYGGKTSAVLIIRNGKIVAESYKKGHDLHTAQRTWSVAKSIAGTLIGYSVEQKKLNIFAPVQIPEWQRQGDPRASLTIDQLMRMSSGLVNDTAGNRTDPLYMGGASVTERATAWPLLYKPGIRFRYANNDTLLAVHAARQQHPEFDPFILFQKLGMTRTYAETDWQGHYILSSQVWTTARDLGRLGMLYLDNGSWNGETLLPENWRDYVSKPSGPQPENRAFGYGATFWLMNKSPGIPDDSFAGFGNRGQYLVIIPSLDMVIVRRGYDSSDNRFDIETFIRDVIAAGKS